MTRIFDKSSYLFLKTYVHYPGDTGILNFTILRKTEVVQQRITFLKIKNFVKREHSGTFMICLKSHKTLDSH